MTTLTLNRDCLIRQLGIQDVEEEIEKIVEIDLSWCKIDRIVANAFQGFRNVEFVELNNNEINKIEETAFEDLINVRIMHLSSNKMIQIDSDVFKGLINLERIEIDDNELLEINPNWFKSLYNLKYLYIRGNMFKKITSNTFYGLAKLEELSLRDNEITETEANAFAGLTSMKTLYFWNNKLSIIDVNSFVGMPNLDKLWLHDNQIAQLQPNMFVALSNLKELYLNNNKLTRIEANSFAGLNCLERLLLRDNEISEIDVNAFVGLSNLISLTLNNNRLKRIDQECFSPLISIALIQLYDNDPDFNVKSFYKKSNQSYSDEKKLNEKGFVSNWDEFIQQFNEIGRDIKDPYIGEIFKDRYKVKEKIGKGSFGIVYLVSDINLHQDKAMKMMDKVDISSCNEQNLLWKINHENIIRYFDHFDWNISAWTYICIITEYCENGDLKQRIDDVKNSNGHFSHEQILKWMIEATNALKFLHSNKIIHRDVKPGNMLLAKENVLKLADLGISKLIESTAGKTYVGSPSYMSPEIFESLYSSRIYSYNTDIWSLGCVLYELIFLQIAFPQGQRDNPPIPDLSLSGRFLSVLKKMLQPDRNQRIESNTLYEELKSIRLISNS